MLVRDWPLSGFNSGFLSCSLTSLSRNINAILLKMVFTLYKEGMVAVSDLAVIFHVRNSYRCEETRKIDHKSNRGWKERKMALLQITFVLSSSFCSFSVRIRLSSGKWKTRVSAKHRSLSYLHFCSNFWKQS